MNDKEKPVTGANKNQPDESVIVNIADPVDIRPHESRIEKSFKYLALVISVAALIISGLTAYWARQADILSVQPKLNFHYQKSVSSYDDLVGLFLDNAGVGPAVIKSFRIKYKGRYVDNWDNVIQPLENKVFIENRPEHTTFFEDDVVKVGGRFDLLVMPKKRIAAGDGYSRMHDLFEQHLDVEIVYCSIYGICWRTCWLNPQCKNRAIPIKWDSGIATR